jgi:hypothetical protein
MTMNFSTRSALPEFHNLIMCRAIRQIFLTVVFALAGSSLLWAQAGPPMITDDTETPERGHFEIQLALTYDQKLRERSVETPLLDFNYGLMDHLELNIELPWETTVSSESGHHPSGIGESKVGLKGRFMDEDKNGVSMSFYPQFQVGGSALKWAHDRQSHQKHMLLPFQIEKSLGPLTVGGEFGVDLQKAHKPAQFYGVVIGHEFNDRFEMMGEVRGASEMRFNRQEWLVNCGFRLKLNALLSLLGSAGSTLKSSEHDHSKFFSYLAIQFTF